MSRVTFLFIGGRRARLAQAESPREMFYGATELPDYGFDVNILEENELPRALPGIRPLARVVRPALGADLALCSRLFRTEALRHTNVVVTNVLSHALALGALASAGQLKARTVAFVMGLASVQGGTTADSRLLRRQTLVAISNREYRHLRRALPNHDVRLVRFGVDTHFWFPEPAVTREDYVLSVGNDPNRDYGTLLAAWKPEFPKLRIVSRLALPATPPNVEVMAGDWRDAPISDQGIRTLIRRARFLVIPLRQTMQPSGQSVTLQAMACKTPVVLTEIAGLWDADSLVDGVTCALAPPGDPLALNRKFRGFLADPARAEALADAAYESIKGRLTVECMAADLANVLAS